MENIDALHTVTPADPIPDSPRVIYERNPLISVLGQVKFPPVLRIDVEAPAAFQDRLRNTYPLFEEQKLPLNLPAGVPVAQQAALSAILQVRRGPVAYNFLSADKAWSIGLTRDSLTLATAKYERWESFLEQMEAALSALREIYAPAFLNRIGLRYQDLIRRSSSGLQNARWADLLRPEISGLLGASQMADKIAAAAGQVNIKLPKGQLLLNHGLAEASDDKEECYVIDSDFFTEENTEVMNAVNVLSTFNRQSGRFFRWCISERLHEALGPRVVAD